MSSLRGLTLPQLLAGAAGLDATVLRSARHIVTENARTLAAAEALRQGAVRMTGGGFGGCVVALTTQQGAEHAISQVAADYRSPQGLPGKPYLCRASDGAGLLERA